VQVNAFNPTRKRADYFCYMGRLVPYKRVDLLVEAFNRLGLPLLLVGEGPEGERLKRMARPNITFAGWLPDEAMRERLERCRAFVFAGEEDFGIAVVEAQAAGAPVIAFSRGGASETVCDRITGLLYNDQSVDSICEAITAFQNGELVVDHEQISVHAHRFSAERFRAEMDRVVNEAWSSHSGRYVRLLREFAEVKL
jgi:glycosyltransferase involved in cell wall biosynthesis